MNFEHHFYECEGIGTFHLIRVDEHIYLNHLQKIYEATLDVKERLGTKSPLNLSRVLFLNYLFDEGRKIVGLKMNLDGRIVTFNKSEKELLDLVLIVQTYTMQHFCVLNKAVTNLLGSSSTSYRKNFSS